MRCSSAITCGVVDRCASIRRHETTAPVIGAKGFRHTSRPHFRAAIGNHRQIEAFTADTFECSPNSSAVPSCQSRNTSTPTRSFRSFGCSMATGYKCVMLRGGCIVDRFEHMRLLAKTLNDCFSKLFRAYFLLAHALDIDIIRVDAIFDSAQPGIMH